MARGTEGCVDRLTLSESGSTGSEASPADVSALRPTTTAEVQGLVREAIARRSPVRIISRGTWLQAGRPVRHAESIVLDGLSGIVDYTPGDLTLTARAGTTLAEIDEVTRAHGQWLTLDPFGSESATLGATIATGSYGPLAHHFGAPRDVVLGAEFVTGTGALVRGGGRVVKN